MNRSSTAQHRLRQPVSPGNLPITLVCASPPPATGLRSAVEARPRPLPALARGGSGDLRGLPIQPAGENVEAAIRRPDIYPFPGRVRVQITDLDSGFVKLAPGDVHVVHLEQRHDTLRQIPI